MADASPYTHIRSTTVPTEGNGVDAALKEAFREARCGPVYSAQIARTKRAITEAGHTPVFIFVPLCVCGPCAPAIAEAKTVEVRVPCESAAVYATLAYRQNAADWATSKETAPIATALETALADYFAQSEETGGTIWQLTFADNSTCRTSIAGVMRLSR